MLDQITAKSIFTFFKFTIPLGILIVAILNYLPKKKELTAEIINIDYFDNTINNATIHATYNIGSKTIKNLKIASIKFTNTGKEILINEGSKSNILNKHLGFSFQDSSRIVFLNKTDELNIGDSVLIMAPNKFKIEFDQWLPNESIEYKFYLSSSRQTKNTLLASTKRDIIGGKVIILDSKSPLQTGRLSHMSIARRKISLMGMFIGVLLCTMLVGSLLWNKYNSIKVIKDWNSLHENKLKEYLKQNYNSLINDDTINKSQSIDAILANPRDLPLKIFKQIDIPYFPITIQLSTWSTVVFAIAFVILLFGVQISFVLFDQYF